MALGWRRNVAPEIELDRPSTLDHGQPVSPFTVMRELGHSSIGLIEKTYGHLLDVRHRAEVVEYREAKVVDLGKRRRA